MPEHRLVLYEKIGPGWHSCHWCSRKVRWLVDAGTRAGALIPDHLDGNGKNNDPANLVPACHSCNTWRNRADRIREGELTVTMSDGTRTRAEPRVCRRCHREFPFVPAAGHRPNRGVFCSKECWRLRKHPVS